MLAVRRNAEEVERLLAEIRGGGNADEARSRLVELTYGDLSRKVLHKLAHEQRLRRRHEPEDIAHRVMERLKGVLEAGRVQTVEELVRTANRNVRWVLGDLARVPQGQEEPGVEGPEREDTANGDEALPLEDWEDLHHQAAFLSGRPGEVFRRRYYDRLPVPEVAAELGVSVRTVQNAWQEALEQLSLKLTGRPFRGGAPKHLGGGRDDGGDGP